jgi:hypothetical protein
LVSLYWFLLRVPLKFNMQIDNKEITIRSAERGNISLFIERYPKEMIIDSAFSFPIMIVQVKIPLESHEFDLIRKLHTSVDIMMIPSNERIKGEELMKQLQKISWISVNSLIHAYRTEIDDYFNGDVIEEMSYELFCRFLEITLMENETILTPVSNTTISELKIQNIGNRQSCRIEENANKAFLIKTGTDVGDELYLAQELEDTANIHFYQEKYRQVILDCATSIEVAFIWILRRKLKNKGKSEKEISNILEKKEGIDNRIGEFNSEFDLKLGKYWPEVHHDLTWKDTTQPKSDWERSWGICPLRNKVIHEGLQIKNKRNARRLIEITDRFIKFVIDKDTENLMSTSNATDKAKIVENWKSTLTDKQVSCLNEINAKGNISLFELYSKWVFHNANPNCWDDKWKIQHLLLRLEVVGLVKAFKGKKPIFLKRTFIKSNLEEIEIRATIP